MSLATDPDARAINALALLSLLIALLVRVPFARTPSSIAGAADLANLLSDLCVAYLAAWIVYFLVSWRPRRQDRNRALQAVGPTALQVTGTAKGLLDELRLTANDRATGPINEKQLAVMVRGIRTTDRSSMVRADMTPSTVLEMLVYFMARAETRVETCLKLGLFLDADLVASLIELRECTLFSSLRHSRDLGGAPQSLFGFVPMIYEYFALCDQTRSMVTTRYGAVLDGVRGFSIAGVCEMKVTNGPLEWRPGSAVPWPDLDGGPEPQ